MSTRWGEPKAAWIKAGRTSCLSRQHQRRVGFWLNYASPHLARTLARATPLRAENLARANPPVRGTVGEGPSVSQPLLLMLRPCRAEPNHGSPAERRERT